MLKRKVARTEDEKDNLLVPAKNNSMIFTSAPWLHTAAIHSVLCRNTEPAEALPKLPVATSAKTLKKEKKELQCFKCISSLFLAGKHGKQNNNVKIVVLAILSYFSYSFWSVYINATIPHLTARSNQSSQSQKRGKKKQLCFHSEK
jgi:hypothetical protein